MIVLIDNGHGIDTKGKRSPDGRLLEYKYTRELAREIVNTLNYCFNINAQLLVPEETDIALSERVRRANKIYDNDNNTILISLHCNAAGDGSAWMSGTGWEIWTSPGQTKADELATFIFKEAEKELPNIKMRTDYSDNDPDKESNFYILKKTKCPAVLTENMFQDNKNDVELLLNDCFKKRLVNLHVNGIIKYIEKYGK